MKAPVLLLWMRKRSRTPKQVGKATAACSALTVNDYARSAIDGRGRFYAVEATTAAEARTIIDAWRKVTADGRNLEAFSVPSRDESGGRGLVVAIGPRALEAFDGAAASIRAWDANIRRHGRVPLSATRALG